VIKTVFVFLLLGILIIPICYAKEKLFWRITDLKPTYILDGKQKGLGSGDHILNYIKQRLPNYQHDIGILALEDFLIASQRDINMCYANLKKNVKREKTFYFSIPSAFQLEYKVAMRPPSLLTVTKPITVSLEALLKDETLTLGLHNQRSYTKTLDNLIFPYLNSKQVYIHHGSHPIKQLLKMLVNKRIDYTLVKPSQLVWYLQTTPLKEQMNITGLKMIEAEKTTMVHVACTKNEWGKQVIDKVNNILLSARKANDYKQGLMRWVPVTDRQAFQHYYHNVFVNSK